jgi:Chaperone of endosialidase
MKRIVFISNLLVLILILHLPIQSCSQNTGIGTSTPTRAKLEVHGVGGPPGSFTSAIFGADGAGISFQRNRPTIGFNQYNDGNSKFMSTGYAAIQYLDPGSGTMNIDMMGSGAANTNTSSAFRALSISNTGNVGIKTNAANASLYVIKESNFDGSAVFGGTEYNSYFHYSSSEHTYIRAGKTGGNVYINDAPGGAIIMGNGFNKVGINTGTPSRPLEIRQTGLTGLLVTEPAQNNNHWEQVVGFYNGGPQSSFKFLYNGQLKGFFRPTDGEFIQSSDWRIKKNIHSLPSLLEKILQLRPVTFELKYRNPDHKISDGFIAQDIQKIFPEMVTVSSYEVEKGITIPDFHALDYNNFKMIAVKGIQEEQGIIEKQEQIQNEINRRLEAIEKKLSAKNK